MHPRDGGLLALLLEDREELELPYERIYSFGRDAIMADAGSPISPTSGDGPSLSRPASDLLGTKVVMESGEILGEIADVMVTLRPPPAVVYELRRSMLDRLFGRTFFIPASVGYALSDNAARLVVPDTTAEIASPDISTLARPEINVRSFTTAPDISNWTEYEDETVLRETDEDATVLRRREDEDNDETLLVRSDEDETIIRRPIKED